MQDAKTSIDESIAGFRREVWKQKLLEQAEADGMAQELGPRHFATFIDREPTLRVTFETAEGIRSISETHQPFGFELVKSKGWSHLCIISDGDTWFRCRECIAGESREIVLVNGSGHLRRLSTSECIFATHDSLQAGHLNDHLRGQIRFA